ncbi:MAG: MATE family efflux transporter, partial [Solobacterium sp.]|nr:MATE family efflux transporter [Solobacterium sp.]
MKKNLLNINLSLLPAVVSLAWPTMLEQLMQTAVQYVDTAMVGSLGTQAVAAAGSTATVSWLVGSSISALGVGFLSYISQADGAGDSERVHRAVAQSVLTVIVCGLFFTALTVSVSGMIPVWMRVDPAIRDITAKYFMILYLPMLFRSASVIFSTVLRALGDSRTPMRVGIIVNLSNVIMNFLLIYSPRTMHIGSLSV